MEKNFLFQILFLSLIFISKCQDNLEYDEEEGYSFDDFNGEKLFKASLKEYLVQNNLYESDRIIKRDEMKKIFLDIITEGEPDNTPQYMERIFQQLTEYFVNVYYKDRKELRGKDIYDLIDIMAISMKFEQMASANSYYEGDDEEENSFDKRDVVGEPTHDV